MITIAICGSQADLTLIDNIVKKYMYLQGIPYHVYHFTAGDEIVSSEKYFDLIFLLLSDGEDIATGKAIGRKMKNGKIICVAEYGQYLERAINEIHAFAYLKKPLNEKKLIPQMIDVLPLIHKENDTSAVVKFKILGIEEGHKLESKLMDFYIDDIYYFEYSNRKIGLKTGNQSYFFYDTMSSLQERMQPYGFYHCHQSYLVNMKYVIDIRGYTICLCNEEKIPLAQKRSMEFRKNFTSFVYQVPGEKEDRQEIMSEAFYL